MTSSTERLIPGDIILCDSAGMDEPTLDCTYCGHPASVELQLQRLDETAEWRTAGRWSICARHLARLNTNSWEGLEHDERLVVMRCA